MIKNERQYRITRAQAKRFSRALRSLRTDKDDRSELHPRLRQLQEEALNSQLRDLEADILDYEALKAGSFAFEKLESISELPRPLNSRPHCEWPQSKGPGWPPRLEGATDPALRSIRIRFCQFHKNKGGGFGLGHRSRRQYVCRRRRHPTSSDSQENICDWPHT